MHMLVGNWLSDAFSDAYSDAKFNAFESQPRREGGREGHRLSSFHDLNFRLLRVFFGENEHRILPS